MVRSIVLAVVALSAVACGPTPTEPSHYAEFSQADLRLGTGAEAAPGLLLTVHYTLWLYNATATDNKGLHVETSAGGEPFTFTLGAGESIRGWDIGLVGMRVGGLRRLVLPPSEAYGPTRRGVIPPDATLLFEVELLEVEDAT